MPVFSYKAKSLDGIVKTGLIEAKDLDELAQLLRGDGLFLAKADTKEGKKNRNISLHILPQKVSIDEKLFLTRNLSVIVSTGLPLVKGFSILAAQSKSNRLKYALNDIAKQVSKGKSLSESFGRFPDVFSELFLGMIEAGEESGTLEDVLKVLSLQLEKEKEIGSKIKKALIYPSILVVAMLLVAIGLSVFVLPKINTFFSGLNADLPITTKMILGSGDFVSTYWPIILTCLTSLIVAFMLAKKTKPGKLAIDTALVKTPYVSSLVKKSNSAAMIRSLSSLLVAGVPLIRTLEITSGTVGNFHFKQAILGAIKGVEKGKKLFVALQPWQDLFPFGALEMIEIGEETGKTSAILKKLAEFYEEEVTNVAESLSSIIEPVLIVVIGIAVGVFAVSIIGPLYSVLGSL